MGHNGRPIDDDLRRRIVAWHFANPTVRSIRAIALAVGCDRRTVQRVIPPFDDGPRARISVLRELVDRAEKHGGVERVLIRALDDLERTGRG